MAGQGWKAARAALATKRRGHAVAQPGDKREFDPCNAQPAWTIQVRGGRLESIVASPETPAPLDAADKRGLAELAAGQVGGISVRVWAVDGEQALVALGVDAEARTAGQWVLIWRSLLPRVYPEIAALIRP